MEWFIYEVHVWALIGCGGPQISLKLSISREENVISCEVFYSIYMLKLNDEQLFLELGPENSLVYMVLKNVPAILF